MVRSYQVTWYHALLLCAHCWAMLVTGFIRAAVGAWWFGTRLLGLVHSCWVPLSFTVWMCEVWCYLPKSCLRLYRQVCACFILRSHAKCSMACILVGYTVSYFAGCCGLLALLFLCGPWQLLQDRRQCYIFFRGNVCTLRLGQLFSSRLVSCSWCEQHAIGKGGIYNEYE